MQQPGALTLADLAPISAIFSGQLGRVDPRSAESCERAIRSTRSPIDVLRETLRQGVKSAATIDWRGMSNLEILERRLNRQIIRKLIRQRGVLDALSAGKKQVITIIEVVNAANVESCRVWTADHVRRLMKYLRP
jgi:hypothetical protein